MHLAPCGKKLVTQSGEDISTTSGDRFDTLDLVEYLKLSHHPVRNYVHTQDIANFLSQFRRSLYILKGDSVTHLRMQRILCRLCQMSWKASSQSILAAPPPPTMNAAPLMTSIMMAV